MKEWECRTGTGAAGGEKWKVKRVFTLASTLQHPRPAGAAQYYSQVQKD